jgi:hypothetical protein
MKDSSSCPMMACPNVRSIRNEISFVIPGVWDSREIATTVCDHCMKLVETKVIGRMSLTAEIKGDKRHA